jgi:hypothetical protein
MAEPDFKWYKNPTKEQIDEVAGSNNKVHFIAFPEKQVVVFPFEIPFLEFVRARGGEISHHKETGLFGTAQKSGMGWMVLTIANKKHLKNKDLTQWEWLGKYVDIKPLAIHSVKPDEKTENIKKEIKQVSNTARDRFKNIYDKKGETSGMEKTSLDKFLKNYGNQNSEN